MLSLIRTSGLALLLLTLLTGVLYPAAITLLAGLFFPFQSGGSLLREGDRVVGSAIIGQPFDDPHYFWGRPSATPTHPYQAGASSGSNLGPSNPALHEAVQSRIAALREAHPDRSGPIPVDLVTASGSGLDPHLSPAAAYYQAGRVARARGLTEEAVRALVQSHVEERTLGLLGEPRVNVLRLNLALEKLSGTGE
jgi:K+-transporting ATPase ATPase C chain